MSGRLGLRGSLLLLAAVVMLPAGIFAQNSKPDNEDKKSKKNKTEQSADIHTGYKVSGGVKLETIKSQQDTLASDNGIAGNEGEGLPTDSLTTPSLDSLSVELSPTDSIGIETDSTGSPTIKENLDSLVTRHSKIFRDSIPISRLTAISLVVPGFAQLYNQQTWKIPVEYAAISAPLLFGLKQNKTYRDYKSQYDNLVKHGATREELDPVQTDMIRHNTYRQLFFAGAVVSYMAFLADGIVNYQGEMTSVKKATTLSMILPGAGQFYNKSYWKIPIVVGGFASMAYIVDWNNRGYKRFKLAYDLVMDDDPETVDEWDGRYDGSFLLNYKNQYRRNRDMAIIGMVGIYIVNIIDAHVDANLKDYDISDDLSFNVEPVVGSFGSLGHGRSNTFGLNLSFTF